MFIDEMFPRKPEEALDQDVARPSAWLTKAKMVVQGDKKVEPFEFKAAVRPLSIHHWARFHITDEQRLLPRRVVSS